MKTNEDPAGQIDGEREGGKERHGRKGDREEATKPEFKSVYAMVDLILSPVT